MTYTSNWAEVIGPDEAARFDALAARVVAVQASRTPALGEGRAVHRRPVASARARLRVRPDLAEVLPPALHVGPFVPGADYLTWVRFSNGSVEAPVREEPDVRGIALKVVGVHGTSALGEGAETHTQDFLLIQSSRLPMADPGEFVALLEANSAGGKAGAPFRLGAKIGYLRAFQVFAGLISGLSKPFPSYATARFNSVTPFRLGPTAARWGLVPVAPASPAPVTKGGLAADLRARIAQGVAWDFQVQLYQDEARTPIEDPTVDWKDAPWITVARLELPPQDGASAAGERVSAFVETLAFDPWHAVEELRPLGAFNRARKPAYFASLGNRPRAPEPDGTEQI